MKFCHQILHSGIQLIVQVEYHARINLAGPDLLSKGNLVNLQLKTFLFKKRKTEADWCLAAGDDGEAHTP